MQEKIKEILSVYLKTAPDQITAATAIDRTAVNSSILLHRMYAKLADAGVIVNNYQQLHTLGDLLKQLGADSVNQQAISSQNGAVQMNEPAITFLPGATNESGSIGIDIEMISAMPITSDFREDSFYTMNFSVTEMAYCILQANPYASFAGLFAAKEAIVKTDNTYKKFQFKDIPVQHLANGKPFHAAFNISISHTEQLAVAVAVPVRLHTAAVKGEVSGTLGNPVSKIPGAVWLLILTSLLLSVIALFLIAGKK